MSKIHCISESLIYEIPVVKSKFATLNKYNSFEK